MRSTQLLPAIAIVLACYGSGAAAASGKESAAENASSGVAPGDADVRGFIEERQRLLSADQIDEAKKLCESWIERTHPVAKAEGYKCSANVFVRRASDSGDHVIISDADQRLAVGGSAPPPRFSGDAVTRAIEQLDRAAELNPSDRSIHQGRMFLALASGNYARGVASLEKSLEQHAQAPLETWLEYTGVFPSTEAEQAVAYLRLLVASYPTSASAHVELGAWLAAAGKKEEARSELQKALAVDDHHAMAHWRLGEVLQSLGDDSRANASYRRSLSLGGDLADERRSAYERFEKARH